MTYEFPDHALHDRSFREQRKLASPTFQPLRLDDPRCQKAELVGAKAATIARLYKEFPGNVPFGIVLPSTIGPSYLDAPPEKASVLIDMLKETAHSSTVYAVRSSALEEDTLDRSFAGQFESILGVRLGPSLLDAVATCIRSSLAPRAMAYRRASHSADRSRIAVLIQELVQADRSGVAFTTHPLTGADEVLLNASYGLGDLLVSGEITPDTIVIKRPGAEPEITIGSKRRMSIVTSKGMTKVPVPESLRAAPSLHGDQATVVAAFARRCATLLGFPVDMEWALAGERVFILQARPITAIPASVRRKP